MKSYVLYIGGVVIGAAILIFIIGFLSYYFHGAPQASEEQLKIWETIRTEAAYSSNTSSISLDDFLSDDKQVQFNNIKQGENDYRYFIDNLSRIANKYDDGYGSNKADLTIPYEDWIKDPQSYRNNMMTFWDKTLYGWKTLFKY